MRASTFSAAAAACRMRTKPTPATVQLRPLRHRESAHDRRRIPLEGRRKTEEWFRHQRFLEALERFEQEQRDYFDRWDRRASANRTITTVTFSSADVTATGAWITIDYTNSPDTTSPTASW